MGLFGTKKVEAVRCQCNAETPRTAAESKASGARAKTLGSGCARCRELADNTVIALSQLHMEPVVDHVTDYAQIAAYGVMTMPALVFDGRVLSSGRVLKPDEIVTLLRKAME